MVGGALGSSMPYGDVALAEKVGCEAPLERSEVRMLT